MIITLAKFQYGSFRLRQLKGCFSTIVHTVVRNAWPPGFKQYTCISPLVFFKKCSLISAEFLKPLLENRKFPCRDLKNDHMIIMLKYFQSSTVKHK